MARNAETVPTDFNTLYIHRKEVMYAMLCGRVSHIHVQDGHTYISTAHI